MYGVRFGSRSSRTAIHLPGNPSSLKGKVDVLEGLQIMFADSVTRTWSLLTRDESIGLFLWNIEDNGEQDWCIY